MSINIENDVHLNETDLNKYADDLLDTELSDNACRIFLGLVDKKLTLSEEVYNRICNVIINDHEQLAKENTIKIIDILIENNQNLSDLCLNALETALQEQQSRILKSYAVRILLSIIEKSINIDFKSSLLNSVSNGLQISSTTTIQSDIIKFFEILIRKQPNVHISQDIIDNMKIYLSKISKNINTKHYIDCGLISSFVLKLLYQRYKIDASLLETFSELVIFQNNIDDKRLLVNLSASYVIYQAIQGQLINGCLSSKIFLHISICSNSKGFNNERLFEYCLKILCALNDEQLKLTNLNGHLLRNLLKDSNFNENPWIQLAVLFGNLYQFIQSSIYTLKNIAEYERNYLSKYPLQKFVVILNRKNVHKEIRQHACLILRFAIETQQTLTNYEIDALENALNDSDSTVSLIVLQAFQDLFENYHDNNIDLTNSYVNKLCTFATESIAHSNEIFTFNTSNLLEIIFKYDLKHEFTFDEIENLCIGLQMNSNGSIHRSISNILQNIISKQSDVPSYTSKLLQLQNLNEEFLQKQTIDCA